jgi:hypothetical protein
MTELAIILGSKGDTKLNHSHPNAVRLAIAALAICGMLISSALQTVASPSALKTVTTDDKTASVGLPDGWKLAKGANGFIYITGPNDDRINLGVLVVAKNAQAGAGVSGDVVFALPYSASLKDKLTTIVQVGAAKQGGSKPQLTFASQTPTKLPMCARLLGSMTDGGQSRKFEAVLCSLQPDYLGFYKNLVFMANIPSDRVAQDRAIVEQIVSSYRVTPAMFKKLLSSYTPLPPHPAAGARAAISGMAPYEDPTNSDCFDYNVIRESPPWEVPIHCGGIQPE